MDGYFFGVVLTRRLQSAASFKFARVFRNRELSMAAARLYAERPRLARLSQDQEKTWRHSFWCKAAWVGAWYWSRVAKALRAKQHEVFAPTLTGLGERSHLLNPEIDLETHILDVVNLMKWQDLSRRRAGWAFLRRHGCFRCRRGDGKVDRVDRDARCVFPGRWAKPGRPAAGARAGGDHQGGPGWCHGTAAAAGGKLQPQRK